MRNLILCLLSMSLVSCDPGATEIYQLDNQSDSTIYISFRVYENGKGMKDTNASFPPHTFHRMYEFGHIGTVHDMGSEFLEYLDSFHVYRDEAHQIKISKDYKSRSNWEYSGERKGKVIRSGDNFYKLTLHNGDL